ncbi:MAG: hypothetical protein OEM52_03520 [bacterium]|nr:hypothetical protein [bacterium]
MKRQHRRLFTLTALMLAALSYSFGSIPVYAGEASGFLYGRVTTKSGNIYTGQLRWGTEEAFWDDIFNGTKDSNPFQKHFDKLTDENSAGTYDKSVREYLKSAQKLRKEAERTNNDKNFKEAEELEAKAEALREKAEQMRERMEEMAQTKVILGGMVVAHWNEFGVTHVFQSRFGDIKKIEITGSEDAELTMKDNQVYQVTGGSNDLGGTIHVKDNSLGDIDLEWKKIKLIEFFDTPPSLNPGVTRMYGTLSTDAGTFSGWIQWDSEECVSTDKIDGDSEDGRVSIAMGSIQSITRRSRRGCTLELYDGRKIDMSGTNDVDQSIRGIYCEDPRFGKIKVEWDGFEKLVFEKKSNSGKGYRDYPDARPLRGTVLDTDGKSQSGRLVYDLDEGFTWEFLNGTMDEVEYFIPFDKISTIKHYSSRYTEVTLRGGEKLKLEGTQDVTESNDGVLLFTTEGKDPTYIDWEHIDEIRFAW